MNRDFALIILAGTVAGIGMICATVLVIVAHANPTLAFSLLTAVVTGVAGVAIGRLTGKPIGS